MRALFIVAALLPLPALSQPKCDDHAAMSEMLESEYGETRQAIALRADGQSFMEVYANAETGSYTILVTQINGTACMADVGTDFELLSEPGGEPV